MYDFKQIEEVLKKHNILDECRNNYIRKKGNEERLVASIRYDAFLEIINNKIKEYIESHKNHEEDIKELNDMKTKLYENKKLLYDPDIDCP